MKERPIPFSGAMVQAILDGRKTQTRRVLKAKFPLAGAIPGKGADRGRVWFGAKQIPLKEKGDLYTFRCRYGVPGDRLWVRESYARFTDPILYLADGRNPVIRYRSGRFMPREASRITLEVVRVKVERLLAITVKDCFDEGIQLMRCPECHLACFGLPGWKCKDLQKTPQEAFWHLWDSINEKRGYGRSKNPFVWAIEFKRI